MVGLVDYTVGLTVPGRCDFYPDFFMKSLLRRLRRFVFNQVRAELQGMIDQEKQKARDEVQRLMESRGGLGGLGGGGGGSVYLGDRRALTRVQGMLMYVPTDDNAIAPHLMLGDVWEANTTQVLRELLEPGMTFIDVGANVGYFTLVGRRAVGAQGRVFAFEPDPRNHWCLRNASDVNGFWDVQASRKALWREAGEMTLRRSAGSCGGHTLIHGGAENEADQEHITVETVTLDAYLQEAVGETLKVDVMKIDAEGAEPAILEGMTRTLEANRRLAIVIEFSPLFLGLAGYEPVPYLERLRDMGFSVGLIDAWGKVQPLDFAALPGWFESVDWPQNLLLRRDA